jgi:HSP20 family protein
MTLIKTKRRFPLGVFADPFESFAPMSRLMDNTVGHWLETPDLRAGLRFDVREDEKSYVFETELAGIAKEDIDITLEDGVLAVSAEKKSASDVNDGAGYHLRERRFGRVERSFRIPLPVDEDNVAAALKDGVLTITLTKVEAAQPRRIEVKS